MSKLKTLLLFSAALTVIGCQRLDDIAYINDNTIKSYQYDAWDGEHEFEIPEGQYEVGDTMIHEFFVTSQGEEEEAYDIAAIYVGDLSTINTDTILVYCHGQSLHMDAYWKRIRLLAHLGGQKHKYGILEMDYRGFGLSEGKPTEKGMNEDVKACLRWLDEQGANSNRVFIYGFSLGSAPATHLAAYFDEFKPQKLILEAPFASAKNIGQESTLINFDTKYIVDLELNNAEKIRDVSQPFCLFHGEEDDYLKISNGEIIYRNYDGLYSEFHRIPNADHGGEMGVPPAMGFEEYLATLTAFLRR